MIAVATALRRGEFGRPEDWNRLYPAFANDPAVWARVDDEQMTARWKDHYLCLYLVRLRDALARWIAEADVRPKLFIAERGSQTIALGGRGLLGALAVQLLFAVCRTQGLEVCSACGMAYAPKRKPAPGRLRYCEPCRKGRAPERHATAAHAQRRAEAYRLHMQGTPPRDISRTLAAPVWRVRTWIRAERDAAKRRLKSASKRRSSRRK
jgi:transposase-like protein